MPEGSKSRVSGVESNRPTTNFPGISVDSNRFYCLVEKSGVGVEPQRLQGLIEQGGFRCVRPRSPLGFGVYGGIVKQ